MANILLTGGAGFIGSHTADALIKAGHQVRVLDLLDPQIHGPHASFPSYLHADVECIKGDVRDPDDVARALDGIEGVYHFAALTGVGQSMYDLRQYVEVNVAGTANLIETIVKRKISLNRFVLASSRAVYGEGCHECPTHGSVSPLPRKRKDLEDGKFDLQCPICSMPLQSAPTGEDNPLHAFSMYAWTKKLQEEQVEYAVRTFDLPAVALRYFNVYGSRQSLKNPYTGVVSIFYNRLQAQKPISLYEHGAPGRDFVHVSDVVQANLLALNSKVKPGTCINVGHGTECTISEVARALAEANACKVTFQDDGEFRMGDIRSCYANIQRARKLLHYEPRVTLREGLTEFVAWARTQDSLDLYQRSVDDLQRYGLLGRTSRKVS